MAKGQRSQRSPARRIQIGAGRETDLRRRSGVREERTTLLVLTNGANTERQYLNAVKAEPWIGAGKVSVVMENGAPAAVVREAARRRDRDDYDEAWVVCDVDDYDTAAAIAEGAARGVSIAWSVPCFEVWLILHREALTAHVEDCRRAQVRLAQVLPGWDKTRVRFADFREGVHDAVGRARRLGDPPSANPSTGMWRLIEAMKGNA